MKKSATLTRGSMPSRSSMFQPIIHSRCSHILRSRLSHRRCTACRRSHPRASCSRRESRRTDTRCRTGGRTPCVLTLCTCSSTSVGGRDGEGVTPRQKHTAQNNESEAAAVSAEARRLTIVSLASRSVASSTRNDGSRPASARERPAVRPKPTTEAVGTLNPRSTQINT